MCFQFNVYIVHSIPSMFNETIENSIDSLSSVLVEKTRTKGFITYITKLHHQEMTDKTRQYSRSWDVIDFKYRLLPVSSYAKKEKYQWYRLHWR